MRALLTSCSIPLAPLASFQAIRVGMVVDLFDIRVAQKPSALGLGWWSSR